MNIRGIRESEVTTLVDNLWRPFAEEMAELDPYNELADNVRNSAIKYRENQFKDSDVASFVAEKEERLIGYTVVVYQETPPVFVRGPEASVEEVYVRPGFRGQNVATALIDRAECWADKRDCEHVTLGVNADNETAQALYKSRDYTVRRYKMDKQLK